MAEMEQARQLIQKWRSLANQYERECTEDEPHNTEAVITLRRCADELSFAIPLAVAHQRGGPTEGQPDRPYCKADQSCCDFCCGN